MIGLALAGGGTKGSYQLGAWMALKELNIKYNIITGSSIGSMNAAVMVEDNIEKCTELWENVQVNNIIKNGFDIEELNFKKIIQHDQFKPFLKQYFKDKGSDIEPFKRMLWQYLDFDKIRKSDIIFGVNLTTFPIRKKEEVLMNHLSDIDIFNSILASCSLFPIFPVTTINNKQYMDGGYSDNLPIDFAFKLGAIKVIAIDLDEEITHQKYLENPYVDYIYPKWDLGSFLHFNKEVIIRNKLLGYYDVMKYYKKYNGFKYTFNKKKNFKSLSKKITLNILNDSIYFNNNGLRNYNKKSRNNNIFSFLNEHIYGEINDYDYFIKCIEEIGVFYEIDPCVVYDVDDFIKQLFVEIKKYNSDNILNEILEIKQLNKKRDFINNYNKKEFVNFLYENKFDYEFKIFLMQTNFSLYLTLVFLESVDENEI